MKSRWRWSARAALQSIGWVLATGCAPTLTDRECHRDFDCAPNVPFCIAGRCLPRSSAPDAAADARFVDASASPADGVVSPPDGFVSPADGSVSPADGFVSPPDGFITPPDAFAARPDAFAARPDGFITPPDAFAQTPDALLTPPDGFLPAPDGFVPPPDGFVPTPDGFVPPPDGFVPPPDARVALPDAALAADAEVADAAPTPDACVPAPEVCNGGDDDCDGVPDNPHGTCYDGPANTRRVGRCRDGVLRCAGAPGPDSLPVCDGEILPVVEVCDGEDNDCDGLIDDVEGACDCLPGQIRDCYPGDPATLGVGPCATGSQSCLGSHTWSACQEPVLPTVELCDGVDNDCDGAADDGLTQLWYRDVDRDSYGDPDRLDETCDPPAGSVLSGGDCNDANAAVNPGAAEICNEIDDNCAGGIDEGVQRLVYLDQDGDGFGDPETAAMGCLTSDTVENGLDCAPLDGDDHPGAAERCDGADNDCDHTTDEAPYSDCAFPHASPVCVLGRCDGPDCDAGWTDANRVSVDGCERGCDLNRQVTELGAPAAGWTGMPGVAIDDEHWGVATVEAAADNVHQRLVFTRDAARGRTTLLDSTNGVGSPVVARAATGYAVAARFGNPSSLFLAWVPDVGAARGVIVPVVPVSDPGLTVTDGVNGSAVHVAWLEIDRNTLLRRMVYATGDATRPDALGESTPLALELEPLSVSPVLLAVGTRVYGAAVLLKENTGRLAVFEVLRGAVGAVGNTDVGLARGISGGVRGSHLVFGVTGARLQASMAVLATVDERTVTVLPAIALPADPRETLDELSAAGSDAGLLVSGTRTTALNGYDSRMLFLRDDPAAFEESAPRLDVLDGFFTRALRLASTGRRIGAAFLHANPDGDMFGFGWLDCQ